MQYNRDILCFHFKLTDGIFVMLMNVIMTTTVYILTCLSMVNFVHSLVDREKGFHVNQISIFLDSHQK